jgi:hypothetical protein
MKCVWWLFVAACLAGTTLDFSAAARGRGYNGSGTAVRAFCLNAAFYEEKG